MAKDSRMWLALIGAAVALSATVGTASARNLSATSQTIRASWRELVFTSGTGGTTTCQVTLEGSLHSRTTAKVIGS